MSLLRSEGKVAREQGTANSSRFGCACALFPVAYSLFPQGEAAHG